MNTINPKEPQKRILKIAIPIIISTTVLLTVIIYFNSSRANAQDLLKNVTPNKVTAVASLPDDFISATTDFSLSLFKQSIDINKNSMISPVSVALALGMTGNGAEGNTQSEFKKLLGGNKLGVDQLNSFYYSLNSKLHSDTVNKLCLANSIWYHNRSLTVKPDFLQSNADFYKASAFKADFQSDETVNAINNWVKKSTNDMVDKVIDKINPHTKLMLFNAVSFDANWDNIFISSNVRNNEFTLSDGSTIKTKFMLSDNEYYLKGSNAEGFQKDYEGRKYSFVAILPNEGISLKEYIEKLDGKSFLSFIKTKSNEVADICLPKFKYDYDVSLVNPLKKLGLSDAFDSKKANFSKMAASPEGNLFIGDVKQKTFIQVDEYGTKAGAVTKVELMAGGVSTSKIVNLNRPFVFAIIENETKLPLFIGTVMNPLK